MGNIPMYFVLACNVSLCWRNCRNAAFISSYMKIEVCILEFGVKRLDK